MSTVNTLFRSGKGFISPYFVVDSLGNLMARTITITGSNLELTPGTKLSYGGETLLSSTTLGAGIVNILGTLTGLNVAGPIAVNGSGSVSIASTGNVSITSTGNVTISPTGSVAMSPTITGNINNINLGATTAGSGRFSTLAVTTSATISPTGNVTINPTGTGAFSPNSSLTLGTTGQTTALYGNLTATSSNQTITLSPTGTGSITINPSAIGNINNVNIGVSIPATGKFTSASVTAPDERWESNTNELATKRLVQNSIMFSYFTRL